MYQVLGRNTRKRFKIKIVLGTIIFLLLLIYMRRRFLFGVFIILLGYGLVRLGVFVSAEQQGSTPESSSTSRFKTLYDSLLSSSFGSESAGSWGNWGTMWNRVYSASIWTPSGDATPSDVVSGKTFYSTSRILQTGQAAVQPTPSPTTPPSGDNSRLNNLYNAVVTPSYGSDSAGSWGNWGAMWNRIYSASTWTATSANAVVTDFRSGKTFYSGNNRTLQTGTGLTDGSVCVNNSDCFTGTCTSFYQDSDADSYGNASVSTKRCGTTYTGYVANNTDCGPNTNTAYPGSATGSTTTFLNTSGAASYDWDCSAGGGAGTIYGPQYYNYTAVPGTTSYWACNAMESCSTRCYAQGSATYYLVTTPKTCGEAGGYTYVYGAYLTTTGYNTSEPCYTYYGNLISATGTQACN